MLWIRKAFRASILVFAFSFVSEFAVSQPRIVGGKDVVNGDYPWMVAIVTRNGDPYLDQFCGGSLIDPEWVLTAAHCVDDTVASDIEIWTNIDNLEVTQNAERRTVEEIFLHPSCFEDGDGDLYNDVALLKLSSPVNNVIPVAFAQSANSAPADTTVRTLGWGDTQSDPVFPTQLQEVDLTTVSIETLRVQLFESDLDDRHLGATGGVGKDACGGDSGGPLFLPDGGPGEGPLLVGITSYGLGCATGVPGVWANVGHFASWIDDVLAGNVGNPPPPPPPTPLVAPQMSVLGRGRVIPNGSRDISTRLATDFGRAIPTGRRKTRVFQVTNRGGAFPLAISSATTTGLSFSLRRPPSSVASGGSSPLAVVFRATTRRNARSSVILFTNDPVNPVYRFLVRGRSSRRR